MAPNAQQIDTVIVGGGQAGLAMSYLLTEQGREHVVLEKSSRIGETWRRRWDSFTLVTPSWMLQLPGHPYEGEAPDGFLARDQVVDHLEEYAAAFDPPLRLGVRVTNVDRRDGDDGYVVRTTAQDYHAANVVVAAGTFQQPRIPALSSRVPAGLTQLHSSEYEHPEALPPGAVLVVGSGQSGCQIAQELHDSGRRVYLCVGRAGRLPRRYRGRDSMWWAVQIGMMDEAVGDLESPDERFTANPQISGRDGGRDVNLHRMARDGIVLLGHLADVQGRTVVLAPDLHDSLAGADEMAAKIRRGVDAYVDEADLDVPDEDVAEPQDGYEQPVLSELDLAEAGVTTILWATGFRWDYSWLGLPVLDDRGYPVQDRGVTAHPGLYFVGLHWLSTRKSGLFYGVGEDAAHVAEHLAARSAA